MTRGYRLLLLGVSLTIWCGSALATPLDIGELDARGMGMAGAQTAAANDYSATFYNPAALTQSRKTETSFGLMVSVPSVSIQLTKPTVTDTHTPLTPPTRMAFTVGVNFPLGSRIDERFALGVLLFSPMDSAIQGEMLSAQAPQFYRFQNRPDRFVAITSLGYRISDQLSVGLGVQLFADLLGQVQVDLRLADRQITQRAARVDFPTKFSPTAGVLYSPTTSTRLGLSWRQGTSLKFYIPSSLILDDLAVLNFNVGGVVLYTPDALHFGGSYTIKDWGLLLSVDGGWYRWSTAPDPSLGISLDADGAVLTGLGIEDRLDLEGPKDIDLAFQDIVVVKTGMEAAITDHWVIRGGYSYRPAPAPIPTGAYNYLDPSSHRVTAGLGLRIDVGPPDIQRNMHFDVGYAATLIPEIFIQKRNGQNDPIGNYRAGGTVHGIAFSIRHTL